MRKAGPVFDLAIAVGILSASGQIPPEATAGYGLCGELSLAGSLPRVTGLPAAEVSERLRSLGIDPRRRPETLLVPEWGAVYRRIGE